MTEFRLIDHRVAVEKFGWVPVKTAGEDLYLPHPAQRFNRWENPKPAPLFSTDASAMELLLERLRTENVNLSPEMGPYGVAMLALNLGSTIQI